MKLPARIKQKSEVKEDRNKLTQQRREIVAKEIIVTTSWIGKSQVNPTNPSSQEERSDKLSLTYLIAVLDTMPAHLQINIF